MVAGGAGGHPFTINYSEAYVYLMINFTKNNMAVWYNYVISQSII